MFFDIQDPDVVEAEHPLRVSQPSSIVGTSPRAHDEEERIPTDPRGALLCANGGSPVPSGRVVDAVILAAGRARRMQPISDGIHKALLPIGDSTILGRLVENLCALDVRRITVVTGYRSEDIRGYLDEHFPDVLINYVHNARFDETNNIVSLAIALEALGQEIEGDDIILCECDLLLDLDVLRGLEACPDPNVAVVDQWRPGMDGTVVTVENGFVNAVYPPERQGPDFSYGGTYKTLNIYRFSRTFVRATFQPLLSAYSTSVDEHCYYEVVLAMLASLPKHRIAAYVIKPSAWVEVDDPNDLENARFHFEPSSRMEILDRAYGGHWNFSILDFSFIANPFFPPPALLAMLRRALPELLANYGSSLPVLNRKMSVFLRCDPNRVQTLNGASQIFPILRSLWSDATVGIPSPTFGEYARSFPRAVNYPVEDGLDLPALHEVAGGSVEKLVVVNPNNPTADLVNSADIFELARSHPGTTIFVDESFLSATHQPSLVTMLESDPLQNLVVLSSLSKVLGVPGLRVGYLYGCDLSLLEAVRHQLPIWNNSSVAEFFIEMLVKFRPALEESMAEWATEALDFSAALRELPRVESVREEAVSFLLLTLADEPTVRVTRLRENLLQRDGINLKDVSNRFSDGRIRIRLAVRSHQDNERLLQALRRELQATGKAAYPSYA